MRRVSRALLIAVVGSAAGACSDGTQITPPDAAPRADAARDRVMAAPAPSYELVAYTSTLGGTANRGDAINNRGWVAGFSSLPSNTVRHAALWRDGAITDLGTLGGPNSSVVWSGLNNSGVVVGIAETAALDPLGEEWSCSAFFPTVTGHVCRGFAWADGDMTAMPTLGGNNSYATDVSASGQVVGWAETAVRDPTCNAPQVLQFRAIRWDPKNGNVQELRPLAGDSASAATAINNRGEAVGISGECDVAVGRFSAQHSVLWDRNGTPTELPNLGGTSWNTPAAISERGDVVGFSNPAGPGDAEGDFISHAFLWTRKDGIRDLGTLAGDAFSEALSINERGQVVGVWFGGSAGLRAFLWEDGVMYDLNALVPGGAPGVLVSARDINDRGQITGDLREAGTGRTLPYVATPAGSEP